MLSHTVYPFAYEKRRKPRRGKPYLSFGKGYGKLVFIFFASVFFAFGFWVMAAFNETKIATAGISEQTVSTVEVKEGDSLWSIAESHCPDHMDVREYIFQLKKVNHLQGSLIFPGQKLTLPEMD